MKSERLYTTREVAEMWNVSPSTVKRWTDSGSLKCQRTAGGHRKFNLHDIAAFQSKQGFEATGLLTTEEWDDPEIEVAVNQKRFEKLRQVIKRQALQNQRVRVRQFLQRLHIRGLEVSELYDEIVIPILTSGRASEKNGSICDGQMRLLSNNLDDGIGHLYPLVTRKRPNQKISLCASIDRSSRVQANAMARIAEIEGWDAFNLGDDVPFECLAEVVEREPVDLVCVASGALKTPPGLEGSFATLFEATHPYRIPVLIHGQSLAPVRKFFSETLYFKTFKKFRSQVARLSK